MDSVRQRGEIDPTERPRFLGDEVTDNPEMDQQLEDIAERMDAARRELEAYTDGWDAGIVAEIKRLVDHLIESATPQELHQLQGQIKGLRSVLARPQELRRSLEADETKLREITAALQEGDES